MLKKKIYYENKHFSSMMCVISNCRYVTKRTSFEKFRVVQHNFARFTLGLFVRMTGSEALFLMIQFVCSYHLFKPKMTIHSNGVFSH